MNAWWEDVFAPSTQGLPDEDRVPAEDRMIRRLGRVPGLILTAARGLLYSKDPAEVAKGALRLASLTDDLPAGAITLNPREAEAVRAVSDAAKDLPTPELAVARASLELGGPGGSFRDAPLRPGEEAPDAAQPLASDDRGEGDDGRGEPNTGPNQEGNNRTDADLDDQVKDLVDKIKQADPEQPGSTPKRFDVLTGQSSEDVPNNVLEQAAAQSGVIPDAARISRDIREGKKSQDEIQADIDKSFGQKSLMGTAFGDINKTVHEQNRDAQGRARAVRTLHAWSVNDGRNPVGRFEKGMEFLGGSKGGGKAPKKPQNKIRE